MQAEDFLCRTGFLCKAHRLLFTFEFSQGNSGSFSVPVQIVEAYEDGFTYRRQGRG